MTKLTLTIAPLYDDGSTGSATDEVVIALPHEGKPTPKEELKACIEFGETILAAYRRHQEDNPEITMLDLTLFIDRTD